MRIHLRAAESAARLAAETELLHSLRQVLMGGRWLLFLAVILAAALRFSFIQASPLAAMALALALLYLSATLLALYRLPPGRVPVVAFLTADVATIGALAGLTGGLDSPFTGLFYLVTLAGAIYFDLLGGILIALAGITMLVLTSVFTPEFWGELARGEIRTQIIPNLLLIGGFAGYLVSQLKDLYQRQIEAREHLRQVEYEERLRQREVEIARGIQLAAFVHPPTHPRFAVTVRFEPAREVGGDFYFFDVEGERLGIILGDVSGKGIPAALVSTSMGFLARSLRPLMRPERFLGAVNANLVELVPEGTFASMVLAILDPDPQEAIFYSAGHPPPLLLAGGEVRQGQTHNLLLGISPDVEFASETLPFRPGDTLILYSDGFIEVRNPAGEELGIEGLAALLRRYGHLPVEKLAERLLEEVRAFGRVTDDLTLVVVRAR